MDTPVTPNYEDAKDGQFLVKLLNRAINQPQKICFNCKTPQSRDGALSPAEIKIANELLNELSSIIGKYRKEMSDKLVALGAHQYIDGEGVLRLDEHELAVFLKGEFEKDYLPGTLTPASKAVTAWVTA